MRIFISYGRKDALDFARKLAAWLKAEGFTPWLDVDQGIPIGSSFDVRIELGIEGSDLMIALLSPWSLRPEGFCRNELLFASAKKRPIIPVRIADVTPPVQIISLNYLDACGDSEQVFKRLRSVIRQVSQQGSMTRREWPCTRAGAPWWAEHRLLNFEEELARHGHRFTGREWLFAQMRKWIDDPSSRLLLLTADAGFGKSAFAAQLTAQLNVRGVHFCSRSLSDSCRPAAWISALVYQLAAQFPAYRREIGILPPPDWTESAESLFRTLIADPLRHLRSKLPVCEPWVFVVDALDEAVAESGFALADLLADSANRIPDWLRIIATSRPDQPILTRFRLDGVRRKHLDAEGEPNMRDIRHYAHGRVDRLEGEGRIPHRAGTADRIAELANGNFLFAKLTLDALDDPDPYCRLSLEETGALPRKLGGLYHAMFRRRFRDPTAYERDILPLLDCLVAARDPLPGDLMRKAADQKQRFFQRGMLALSQFLDNGAAGYRLFHKSLGDWLAQPEESAEFAASPDEGIKCLSVACWDEYQSGAEKASDYALAHLPEMLGRTQRWDDLETLLTDIEFLEQKTKHISVFELANDFSTAVMALPSDRTQKKILELLEEAIRRDIHFIAQNKDDYPQGMFQCLWNHGWWYDCADAKKYYETPKGGWKRPPPWENNDPKLHRLLEKWREEKKEREPQLTWIRTMRPPPVRIGTALKAVLRGHTEWVTSIAFSPDGRRIASGANDKTVRIWNATTGIQEAVLKGHENFIHTVSFSPNGQYIASGSADKTLRLWDATTGIIQSVFCKHEGSVKSIFFSPNGRLIAGATDDNTIRLWDAEKGVQQSALQGHEAAVSSVSFSPDNRYVVSGSEDKTVRVWDVATESPKAVLRGHKDKVTCVSFSPDSLRIASGSWDNTLRLWDTDTGLELAVLSEHKNKLTSIAFSPDGRLLASGGWDKTVRIWDAVTGNERIVLSGHEHTVTTMSFSPDSRRIATGSWDKSIRLWDAAAKIEQPVLCGHKRSVTCVDFSLDGHWIGSGSWDKTVRLWEATTGAPQTVFRGHDGLIADVSFSPDGRYIASGSSDNTVRLWNVAKGTMKAILCGHESHVTSVSFSSDNLHFASGSQDKTIRIWNASTGEQVAALHGHKKGIKSVSFSPDGLLLVSGSADNTIRLWDFMTGIQQKVLHVQKGDIQSLSFSYDGRRIFNGSPVLDNTVNVWDAETGQSLESMRRFDGMRPDGASAHDLPFVALSHDDETHVYRLDALHQPIAMIPLASDKIIAPHPNGRVWAIASYKNRLFNILSLEKKGICYYPSSTKK